MSAEGRIHHPAREASDAGVHGAFAPGAFVVLRSPRSLRGATAVVRRPVPGGWEVEVRTPAGTPMHLVVAERAMLPA